MLILDGVKYRLWTPKDEEKEFHPMIREHSTEIFGETSIYFDIKHMLKSKSGIGSIPDAYVIDLSKPYKWFIVENELASHRVYDHIFPQVSKFIDAIERLDTQREVREVLYNEITEDKVRKAFVEKMINPEEIHHFLSNLLSETPTIAIVIDRISDEVDQASKSLGKLGDTKVVEFKTFIREDAPTVHAHLFEPIRVARTLDKGSKTTTETPEKGEIIPQSDYGLPLLESLVELGGGAKVPEVLKRIHQKLEAKMKPKDYETLKSGGIRWEIQAQWERNTLKNEGYLKKDSKRGTWEITDEGRKFYAILKQK